MEAKVVIHIRTAELAEMTKSWIGWVIWPIEYDDIPNNVIAVRPWVIYDDDPDFKSWEIISDL